jgi:hypothetical protein
LTSAGRAGGSAFWRPALPSLEYAIRDLFAVAERNDGIRQSPAFPKPRHIDIPIARTRPMTK